MCILDPHKQTIISERRGGNSCSELATKYAVSYGTMYKFLKSCGEKFSRLTLTAEQEESLIADYLSGIRHEQLGKKYGISRVSARNYTQRRELGRLPQYRVKAINESFFKELNVDSLWVLGWFFSDGNTSKSSNKFSVTVHRQDEGVLLKIQSLMGYDKDSIYRPEKKPVSSLYGCHPAIHTDLVNLGCMPAKSLIIRYPITLTDDWQHWAFLRGVFEGDGSIGFKSKANKPGFNCEIASGSLVFLQDIRRLLKSRLDIDCKIKERPNSNSKKLVLLGGRDSIMRFLDAIYENGNAKHYLDRKFKVYLEMKDILKRTYIGGINPDNYAEGYFLNGEKVYYVRGIAAFAREVGVDEDIFWNLMRPVKRRFKPRPHGWTRPTPQQIAAARASNSLIIKDYSQPVAPISLSP